MSVEGAPPQERPFLLRELEALAQRAPAETSDLSALRTLLGGELPERTLRAVTKWMKPSRPDDLRARAGWLTGVAERLGLGKLLTEAEPREEAAAPATLAEAPVITPEPPAEVAEPPPAMVAAPAHGAESVPAWEVEPEPDSAVAHQAQADLAEQLREWILGGDAEDDRRADEEMIRLFEQGSAHDLQAARAALAGFGTGILYRFAARAALNPRLLEGVSRAVDSAMLDRIVKDVVHYDMWGFASQAAERLHRYRREGSSGPVDEALLRLLRGGPSHLRDVLAQKLRTSDGNLLADLVGPVSHE